jgi:hypothetical protein
VVFLSIARYVSGYCLKVDHDSHLLNPNLLANHDNLIAFQAIRLVKLKEALKPKKCCKLFLHSAELLREISIFEAFENKMLNRNLDLWDRKYHE